MESLQHTQCISSPFRPMVLLPHSRFAITLSMRRNPKFTAKFRSSRVASNSDTIVESAGILSNREDEFGDLKSWMERNGLPPSKVMPKEKPSRDSKHRPIHYVAASEDLQEGGVAFSASNSLVEVLGHETAELLTTNELSELACLAFYLMYEKKQGKKSFWYPCIRELDRQRVAVGPVGYDFPLEIKKRASEISPDLKGTSIFLVGINSSYKSSLGRILADALRYCYFDSDCLVEEAAGGKMSTISIIDKDEEGYLASETEVLKQLSSMGRLVVCAGNGAVKSARNLALLRHGISVWIDVPLELVAREITEDRIQFSASDMLACKSSSEVYDQVITLYNSAKSGYETADVTISLQRVASQLGVCDLDAVTVEDLFLEVTKEIEKLVRRKKMMEEAGRPF